VKNSFGKSVGRGLYAAALAALLPFALATPVAAVTDQVDQSMTATSAFSFQSNVASMAQTFTAGLTGQVDRVTLPAYTPTGFANFSVSLRTVGSNGQPTATVLATSQPASGAFPCCGWRDFTFPTPYPSVTSGTKYAIVVRVSLGVLRWPDSGSAVGYAAGRQYIGSNGTTWYTTTHGSFGFKEWVTTNVNLAPVVTVADSAVRVAEGTAPANTGTCSDTDGDTVTLTASTGTVSACTGGAFTWTQAAADEAPTQTVTITANDGNGLTSTATFSLEVFAVAPTAQILSDPINIPEGTPVPFTGAGSSPSAVDNSAGISLDWAVTKNGAGYAHGTGSSFTFTPDDEGTYVVTLTATDDGGMPGSTSMSMIGTNVAPKVSGVSYSSPTAPVVAPHQTLSFSGAFSDVDHNDTYVTTWNFGDGGTATGTSPTHQYASAGTYTVTFRVDDKEGGITTGTTTVRVQTFQQSIAYISQGVQGLSGLNAGQKNSLTAKLNAASDAAARGNSVAASNQLNAFLNELQADVNAGKVSAAAAATLRGEVRAIQGGLGTLSRLLRVWPIGA
jgi:PKD repeat protein